MMVEMSTRRGWGSIQPIQPSHLFILELNSRARLFCEAVGRKVHGEKKTFQRRLGRNRWNLPIISFIAHRLQR